MEKMAIILRFRELTPGTDTIQEHAKLRAGGGYVWWGWWKKGAEPDATALLADLAQRARAGALAAYLIDTSAERMHQAQVADVVGGPLPQEEWRFVPEYYRGDRSVAAWFKLVSIELDREYDPQVESQIGQATIAIAAERHT
jgi:hypothetical protein